MQNTVIVADGKDTTLRKYILCNSGNRNQTKQIQKNICAARLGLPLADRYSQPVPKQSMSYNTLYD